MGSVLTSAAPPFEEVINKALKPYSLKDTDGWIHKLNSLIQTLKDKKATPNSLGNFIPELQNIVRFLQHLAKFSSPQSRAEWYNTTYNVREKPAPIARYECDIAKAQINSMEDEVSRVKKVMDEKTQDLQTTNERLLQQQSLTEGEKLTLKDDLFVVLKEKENLVQANEELKERHSQTEERIQRLRLQNEDLTQRLAKEMSDKVSKDESSLENVNIKNRPMIVAEEYNHFRTNAWFVAKEHLDKKAIPNKEALKTLSDVLKNAETYAKIKQKEVTYGIYSVFSQQSIEGAKLLARLTPQSKMATVEVKKIPDGLKNAIGDFLRTTADTADISAIVEDIHAESGPSAEASFRHTMSGVKKSDKLCLRALDLDDYMKECARLAWKMSVQRPPMTFDNEKGIGETWKGQRYQEVFYGSAEPTTPGNVVKFYVFPTLKHNNATMVKGTVFVDKKHEN